MEILELGSPVVIIAVIVIALIVQTITDPRGEYEARQQRKLERENRGEYDKD